MGFLGDLFATKGNVEVRVTVARIPKGASYRYKLGFIKVAGPGTSRPIAAPVHTRWTGYRDDTFFEKPLPVGAYHLVVIVQPMLPGSDGKLKRDASRDVPFWPVERAFEITAGNKTVVRADITFPLAGLG